MLSLFSKYYLTLKKHFQYGGKLLGVGSYGSVISEPIPPLNGPVLINSDNNYIMLSERELRKEITSNFTIYSNKSVAKFFQRKEDYYTELGLMYLIEVRILPEIETLLSSKKLPHNFFCKKYSEGPINYIELFNRSRIYNNNWLGINDTISLKEELKKFFHKVIIYEKGTPFVEKELVVRLHGLLSLTTLLYELALKKIYVPDMKLANLIFDNENKIKLIDYSYMNYYPYIYAEYMKKIETTIVFLIYSPYSFDYQCFFRKMKAEEMINFEGKIIEYIGKKRKELEEIPRGTQQYNNLQKELNNYLLLESQYKDTNNLFTIFVNYLKNFTNKRKISDNYPIQIPLKKVDNSDFILTIDLHNYQDIENIVKKSFIIINSTEHSAYITKLLQLPYNTITLYHQQLYSYGIMLLFTLFDDYSGLKPEIEIDIIILTFMCLIHYVETETIIIPSMTCVYNKSQEILSKL